MEAQSKFLKVIIFLLLISLIFNFYSFSRIGNLSTAVDRIHSDLQWENDRIAQQVNSLSRQLHDIQEQEKWIIKKEFLANEEKSSPEEIHVSLEWTFKEIETNAQVTLLFRENSTVDWKEIEASNTNGTNYIAHLVLSSDNDYEYQIVAKDSTIVTSNIKQIPQRIYKPTQMVSNGYGFGEDQYGNLTDFEAYIDMLEPPLFEFFKMKEASLQAYVGENLIKETPFKLAYPDLPEERQHYSAIIGSFDEQPTSIRIVVEYNNGTIHEGEIWPNDTFNRGWNN
ncbi:hypothetical protein BKP35_01370 [Anaerobacillus arseniciselenatis]|uniref:Uncharacterized protein n=1 Tax=Anaerobacillus arseniciselenatis TaxID=85682 RepID=A0A1S2LTL5_9BACI|nr:hypothetical protein [Anaerobacillus arseniciselenatis]OIJ15674.1 hypothetical protein BKP35_01370 [Anaerobacillus arseniciselenatis]